MVRICQSGFYPSFEFSKIMIKEIVFCVYVCVGLKTTGGSLLSFHPMGYGN